MRAFADVDAMTAPTIHRAPITLVTAYFALDANAAPREDGRGPGDYYRWMTDFLPRVRWPLVIFCDEQSAPTIKRLRGDKPAVVRITRFEDFRVHRYRDAINAHAAQRNPGFPADLAPIYHEKANFVRRAIFDNPFDSAWFFWCDISLIRQTNASIAQAAFRFLPRTEWPNLQICREQFAGKAVFFGATSPPPPQNLWVWGTFWGGQVAPVARFCDAYYRLLDERVAKFNALPAGHVMPRGLGFYVDEVLFNALAAGRLDGMRVFTQDDLRWGRFCRVNKLGAAHAVTRLYPLCGARFPWARLGREISIIRAVLAIARRLRRGFAATSSGKV